MAGGFFNSQNEGLLNAYFGKTSSLGTLSGAPTIFIALSSTAPSANGTGITEPVGGGYARVSTAAADWGTATSANPSVIANANSVDFPQATADWAAGANMVAFVAFDALTTGTPIFWGTLATPKPVLTDDTPNFPAGELTASLASTA